MTDINQRLAALTAHRECHTMASVIQGKSDIGSLQDWKNNPLMKSWARAHSASQDETAGIQELSSMVLEARRPDAIGRDLVRMFETTHDAVKVRKPKRGKAVRTDRGTLSIHSRGERNDFITITPDDEIEVSEDWDRKYVEDAEWNVASANAMDVAMTLQELETEVIIAKIEGVSDSDSAGHVTYPSGALAADTLIDAWTKVKEQDATPNVCVVSPRGIGQLLKDDDFKDSTLLGEFADYGMGRFGMFMGMQILVSSLVNNAKAYVFDTNRLVFMALRRDRLIVPYEQQPHVTGIQVSTRYGMEIADSKALSPIT